jgi:hypothetical protein
VVKKLSSKLIKDAEIVKGFPNLRRVQVDYCLFFSAHRFLAPMSHLARDLPPRAVPQWWSSSRRGSNQSPAAGFRINCRVQVESWKSKQLKPFETFTNGNSLRKFGE